MMVGDDIRDLVMKNLNTLGNVMNLQSDSHSHYDESKWGIEVQNNCGKVLLFDATCALITLI
jgi:hypothetical protein